MRFSNRTEAGQELAARLRGHLPDDTVVLGLPRGGVPVAFEVARALGFPLDVIVVRKLGLPSHPELAMGAIGEDGIRVIDREVVRAAGVTPDILTQVERVERVALEERAARLRPGDGRIDLTGRTALIVDDGIATGSTARAACEVARAQGARSVIVAAPVAPIDAEARLEPEADEVVVVSSPAQFGAVGQFYVDFGPVSDDVVAELLTAEEDRHQSRAEVLDVSIPTSSALLPGTLTWPAAASGVVVFAHGTSSSRHSPRNRAVAQALNRAGLGTLLFDLLTSAEEQDRADVLDVELLGGRLLEATEWLVRQPTVDGLPIGYFGASTGAAAALWAAADPQAPIAAIVSRGGRPDLAGSRLPAVVAPTLLIVGSLDTAVLELNDEAAAAMRCEVALAVVPGATHLFEEPGTLDLAANSARAWFLEHFAHHRRPEPTTGLRTGSGFVADG